MNKPNCLLLEFDNKSSKHWLWRHLMKAKLRMRGICQTKKKNLDFLRLLC